MSQVHVRQVPLATSTDAQRVVGSWFPTSYYGNFRAKSRADLAHYFRQLAQPSPPKKFVDRQTVEATNHLFSEHDNRFRFECDPLVRNTQAGFGKRKSQTNLRGEFNPLLISWIPSNTPGKTLVENMKITSYADDYNHATTSSRILSEIQSLKNDGEKKSTLSPSSTTSVYSRGYTHGQPDHERSKEIRRETYQRFLSARTHLSKQKGSGRGGSVASCMVWNNTNDDNKPSLPKDTTITTVAPIPVQPRVVTDNNNTPIPRQRAQSAGPRLVSTVSNPPPAPAATHKSVPSQSMQMFKTTIATNERPHTATTTSREHYTGNNFGPKVSIPRATAPYEQSYSNRMQSLITKYM